MGMKARKPPDKAQAIFRNLDAVKELGLAQGRHMHRADGMCVTEAIAWLAGEPHSDHPECVSPAIAEFLRRWNDLIYDEGPRTATLADLIQPAIGTHTGDEIVEDRLQWMIADWSVRVAAPAFLRIAGFASTARSLSELDELGDGASALKAIRSLWGAPPPPTRWESRLSEELAAMPWVGDIRHAALVIATETINRCGIRAADQTSWIASKPPRLGDAVRAGLSRTSTLVPLDPDVSSACERDLRLKAVRWADAVPRSIAIDSASALALKAAKAAAFERAQAAASARTRKKAAARANREAWRALDPALKSTRKSARRLVIAMCEIANASNN